MLRIISFALLFLSLSCKSGEGSRSDLSSFPDIQFIPKDTDSAREAAAAAAPSGPNVPLVLLKRSPEIKECKPENVPICPEEEYVNSYRCVILKNNNQLLSDDEQISGFGPSLCQARRSLFLNGCSAKVTLHEPYQISCHPYADEGHCPATEEVCGTTPNEPTRCYPASYDGEDLNLSNRPEVWGKNECDARNKLKRRACNLGLNPKSMQEIKCEKEASTLVCPPIWKNCVVQENELSECKLSKVGEITLKQPIKAIGGSRCEAMYRAQELACRYEKVDIKDFSHIECKSLGSNDMPIRPSLIAP